jgi:8-oxo-dGTP diphosphatase
MPLPHRIATLLYCFDDAGQVLLMERRREPNKGLFSPPGGKLRIDEGESPHACACREAQEELGLDLEVADFRLAGMVSEHGYEGQAHWLMFLFELLKPLRELPPEHEEGAFCFTPGENLNTLPLPQTDRERIWPWFWKYRGGFFAAHCRCLSDGRQEWALEESRDG